MGATDGDVVLRLLIKGMDPGEIERLAAMQGQALQTEAIKINARIRELQDQHNRLYIAADRKRIADQIKAEQDRGRVVQQLFADEEKALRRLNAEREKAAAQQSRGLADLANVARIGGAAAGAVMAGLHAFKEFGEEVIRTTQIYGSLKGSIDEMRRATGGEVADIDLITAKNRALQKDLQLTDHQFGSVAAAAQQYADALGIDTKEALDSLIDGLATGRVKMLQHAGIVIDAKKAVDDYARSIGELSEELTDEQKLHAIQGAALEKIEEKTKNAAEGSNSLAHMLSATFTGIKNATTGTLAAIGNLQIGAAQTQEYLINLSYQSGEITLAEAKRRYAELDRLRKAELDKAHEDYLKMAADRAMGEGLAAYGGDMGEGTTAEPFRVLEGPHSFTGLGADTKKIAEEAKRRAARRRELRKQADEILAPIERQTFAARRGREANIFAGMDIGTASETLAPEGEGIEAEQELRKLADSATAGIPALERWQDEVQKAVDATDVWKTETADAFAMVTEAGHQMAQAVGESLAGALAGDSSRGLADASRNIIKALSAQAFVRSLFKLAEGFDHLSNPLTAWMAPGDFKAAAAWAAVGTGAGLAARAIPTGGGGGGGGTTGIPTQRRGGDFGAAPAARSGGGSDLPALTIQVGAFMGTEDELGRIMDKAAQAWMAKTGRSFAGRT